MIVLLIVIQRYSIRSRKFQAIHIYLLRLLCAESQLCLHRSHFDEAIGLWRKGLFVQLMHEIGMQRMESGIVTYFALSPPGSSENNEQHMEHRFTPPFYMNKCKQPKLKYTIAKKIKEFTYFDLIWLRAPGVALLMITQHTFPFDLRLLGNFDELMILQFAAIQYRISVWKMERVFANSRKSISNVVSNDPILKSKSVLKKFNKWKIRKWILHLIRIQSK